MRHWEKHPADTARLFDLNGFVALPGFVTGDELADIVTAVDRYIREVAPTRPETEIFFENKADRSTKISVAGRVGATSRM